MIGVGLGLAVVVAALPFVWPVAVSLIAAACWVLFCWGGWIGRVATITALAFLTASAFT